MPSGLTGVVFRHNMSVGEARALLYEQVSTGTRCPVCDRVAKVYSRKLSADMANFLIKLYKEVGGIPYKYVESRRILGMKPRAKMGKEDPNANRKKSVGGEKASSEGAYLVHWGLVDKEGPGEYAITPKGVKFVMGRIRVRSRAVIFNGALREIDGPYITIHDALRDEFNYEELMEE